MAPWILLSDVRFGHVVAHGPLTEWPGGGLVLTDGQQPMLCRLSPLQIAGTVVVRKGMQTGGSGRRQDSQTSKTTS